MLPFSNKFLFTIKEAFKISSTITDCYSRNYFFKIFENRFKQTQTEGVNSILLFIDLDKFKPVNDQLGHTTGDAVLKVIGEFLRSRFRMADVVT